MPHCAKKVVNYPASRFFYKAGAKPRIMPQVNLQITAVNLHVFALPPLK